MKKNFLKKLAFTMAFATVFTTLAPAAGVFAAKAPSLTVGKKLTLLLGTERESHDINVNNKVSGSKYAWSTSNKAVATVNSKGIVEGQKVGSAKVTLKITLPTKKTATLTTTVDVKDNIKEVAINNAPKEALTVGQEYDFNRTIVETFGGNTKAHKGAVTRWFLNETETATINDSGVFKATAAGEYEVTAKSFQSKAKYNEYLKSGDVKLVTATSETVKVKVVPSITEVKQVNSTKINVSFDTDMSKVVTKDNLKVASLIGDTKVNQLVKEVKFDTTGKVATVELYLPFSGGTKYVVNYTDLEAMFVAAKAEVAEVAQVRINTTSVDYTKGLQPIEFSLLNKDGVDITTPELSQRVSFTIDNNVGYLANINEIALFAKGDVATVTATFHTYNYDPTTYQEIVVKTTASIVAVDGPTVGVGSEVQATIIKSDATLDWNKAANTVLATGDQNFKIFARIKKSDNKTYVNSTDAGSNITFKSSNTEIISVDPTSGMIYPIKEGSAVVIILYDNTPMSTLTVTVRGKRELAQVSLDKTTLVVTNAIEENAKVKVTMKDQLGDDFAAAINIVDVDSNAVKGLLTLTGAKELTFKSLGATKGNYQYLIKVGNRTVALYVTVQEPVNTDVSYRRLELNTQKVDLKTAKDDVLKTVKVTLKEYAKNNVVLNNLEFPTQASYTLKFNGVELNDGDDALNGIALSSLLDGTIEVVSGVNGSLVKLAKGTYTVTASVGGTVVGTQSFLVEDTTPAVTNTLTSATTTKTSVFAIAKENFKYFLNSDEVEDYTVSQVKYAKAGVVGTATSATDVVTLGDVTIISVTFTKDAAGTTLAETFTANVGKTVTVTQ